MPELKWPCEVLDRIPRRPTTEEVNRPTWLASTSRPAMTRGLRDGRLPSDHLFHSSHRLRHVDR